MTFWKKYSLGITLVILFLVAWVLMSWADWVHFWSQQILHHQSADVFGSSGYIWRWGLDTFSNWQADFLGQGIAVIMGAYLIFKGSEQSRDTSEEVQQIVQDIEREVRGPQAARQAEQRTQATVERGGPLRNYGLGYFLLGGFVLAWALMTWMGWMHFAATEQEHGQSAQVFGSSGYIWYWIRQTFMNWQADALGHAVLVIGSAYLLYKGSSESRGSMDQIKASVQRTRQALRPSEQQLPDGTPVYVETRPAPSAQQTAGFFKRYGLALFSLGLFLVSWILQTWGGWMYFVSDQAAHHAAADLFGPSGYIWLWGEDTFSNWQSDLLWDGLLVLVGAYLIFQGSAESKDGDERIEKLAYDVERQVRGDERARAAQGSTSRHVLGDAWHHRGLAYSLIIAGVIAWALMTWMGWMNFVSTQQEHGAAAAVFGASGYIWQWATLTLENWQSDILGNAVVVIGSAYLLYKGSAMSKESDEEIEQALQRIQQTLQQQPAERSRAHVE
ncbi:MAG TPA: DUF6766 family protein [Chloroflexota bacterium]|nr:DUF6766 family protein [Chloroflexota bacterium]